MSGVISRMHDLESLLERYPEIEEISVDKDFNFLDTNPSLFIRCKHSPEVLKLLEDLKVVFEGYPKIYIGYNMEDLLFAGKQTLWYNNKFYK